MDIKVLGPGCARCQETEELVRGRGGGGQAARPRWRR